MTLFVSCSILAYVSIISPTWFSKYSPKTPSTFSRLANVHCEFPINHAFSGIISDLESLRKQDKSKRVPMTAPLSSDLGVEIFCNGVTLVLAHNNDTFIVPFKRNYLMEMTAANATLLGGMTKIVFLAHNNICIRSNHNF